MKIFFTWDDGAPEDIRLFELHEKYEIPGMFFVPTQNIEGRKVITSEEIRKYESNMISFGGHTANHVYLTTIPFEKVENEIADNKSYLEDVLGHEIEHFCLPGGKYNKDILDVSFKYFKTVRTTNTMCFDKSGKLVRPSFHIYPRRIKSLAGNSLIRNKSVSDFFKVLEMSRKDYFDIIYEFLRIKAEEDSQIVFWGHSWEIEELGLWEKVEALFSTMRKAYWENLGRYDDILS